MADKKKVTSSYSVIVKITNTLDIFLNLNGAVSLNGMNEV